MTNCKEVETVDALERGPLSRARARVHLDDKLIRSVASQAASMARRDRLLGKPRSIEGFAELVIRATVGAINASAADPRFDDWEFEKRAIACCTDEQAKQSWRRWRGFAYEA
jgi:hypothetical protein